MADEWGRHLGGETVSFRRRSTGTVTDGFESRSFGQWFTVDGCAVKYGVSDSEQQSATRDEVLHSAVVYAPPMGDSLTEFDEARLPNDDATYSVDGRPVTWKRPFTGEVVGTEIRLKKVAG